MFVRVLVTVFVCACARVYVCTRVRVCASPSLPHTEEGWSDHYEPFYMYEREGGRERGWRERERDVEEVRPKPPPQQC